MNISNSNISKTLLSLILTMTLGLSLSANADDSVQIKSSLMSRMTSATGSFISSGVGAILSPNFDTVEVSTKLKEANSTLDIGVLKAFGDNPNSFLFNQINLNRHDERTSLNLGLGFRSLNQDETWMTGVNAFYDHEFPDDHKQNGIGFEIVSSVFESRVNTYNGTTGYIKDKSGTDSKVLDGRDMGFNVALPYLPGLMFGMNAVQWDGVDNLKDQKMRKYSLGGALSDNLTLSYIRTDYKDASKKDTDSISLNYTWTFGQQKHVRPTLFTLSNKPYQFQKLSAERHDLVQRENYLIKKKSGTLTVTGI
jgi:adhesin/invasin